MTRAHRTAARTSADDQLAAIPSCYADMLHAVARLGEPFDAATLRRAMTSDVPAPRIDVAALERQIERLVNHLTQVAGRLLAEARRLDHPAAGSGRSFDRLADSGLISRAQRDRLVEVIDTRNVLQHDYLAVAPGRLVDAVEILRRDTHGLVQALGRLAADLDALELRRRG